MNGDFMFLPESIAALSALNKSQTKSTLLKIRIQASPDDRFGIIYIGDIYQETVFFAKRGLQNWKNGDICKKLNKTAPH